MLPSSLNFSPNNSEQGCTCARTKNSILSFPLFYVALAVESYLRPREKHGSHPFNFAVSLLSSSLLKLLARASRLASSTAFFGHLSPPLSLDRVASSLISPPFVFRLIQPRAVHQNPRRRMARSIAPSFPAASIVSRSGTF